MSLWFWTGVGLLGGVSALVRFAVDRAVAARAGRGLPYGTFAVNASASFLLGLVTGLTLSGDALLLVGAATIGSYSTFSTWMLETHRLSEQRRTAAAVANVVLSLGVGVGVAAVGRIIGGGI